MDLGEEAVQVEVEEVNLDLVDEVQEQSPLNHINMPESISLKGKNTFLSLEI